LRGEIEMAAEYRVLMTCSIDVGNGEHVNFFFDADHHRKWGWTCYLIKYLFGYDFKSSEYSVFIIRYLFKYMIMISYFKHAITALVCC
jgi:hypothetical protein